ncbi:hypothetical protein [Actinokineospora sp. NPDC004072]
MDATVESAISAVHLDDEYAQERWFEFLRTTAEQHQDGDWGQLSSALAEGAMAAGIDNHVVETFVEHMNNYDPAPAETMQAIAFLSTVDLQESYRQLTATPAVGDESAWYAFLAERGPYWDGTDAAWEPFKTWFLYEAEQNAVETYATTFIEYAESQGDKAAVFREYGVPIAVAGEQQTTEDKQDVSTFPEMKPGDSGEWVEYLDRMLTSRGF